MVLVDIPIPKNCDECPCFIKISIAYDETYGCCFTHSNKGRKKPERPQDCPLVDAEDDYK